MRVLICGTKELTPVQEQSATSYLVAILEELKQDKDCVLYGDIKGIGKLVANVVKQFNFPSQMIKADHSRGASILRDKQLVETADKILFIWDKHMPYDQYIKYIIEYARYLNKQYQVFYL